MSVTVSDGQLTDSGSFTLVVNPVNDAPVLSSIGSQIIDEDNIFTYTLLASDVDNIELEYTASVDGNASVSIDGSSLSITPYLNYHGDIAVSVTVSDGQLTDSGSFILTVNPINDAPVLDTISDVDFDEDTSTSISVSGSDIDGDVLTFSITGGSEITATLDGSDITFTASENFNGSETFTVTITDSNLSDSQSIIVTVNPVNLSLIHISEPTRPY